MHQAAITKVSIKKGKCYVDPTADRHYLEVTKEGQGETIE